MYSSSPRVVRTRRARDVAIASAPARASMDVLGARARASEGAYFKSRQERDVEKLARARRDDVDRPRALPRVAGRADDSVDARADVLSSVHAHALRLTRGAAGETAVVRREVGRADAASIDHARAGAATTVRAWMPLGGGRALGRRDWAREVRADLQRAETRRASMSPMEIRALESSHAAQRRALLGGVRALAYGTVLCLVGVVGGGVVAGSMLDISTRGDFERAFKATFEPYVDRARAAAVPYKAWVSSDVCATDGVATRARALQNSAAVRRLRKKLGRRGGDDSGPW